MVLRGLRSSRFRPAKVGRSRKPSSNPVHHLSWPVWIIEGSGIICTVDTDVIGVSELVGSVRMWLLWMWLPLTAGV